MAIVIPLRVTTALIGLLVGYYAGLIMEHKGWRKNSLGQFVSTLAFVYEKGRDTYDYYTDSDDDYDNDITNSGAPDVITSDDEVDTDYSDDED